MAPPLYCAHVTQGLVQGLFLGLALGPGWEEKTPGISSHTLWLTEILFSWSFQSFCCVLLLYSFGTWPIQGSNLEKRRGKKPLKLTSIKGHYLSFDFLP